MPFWHVAHEVMQSLHCVNRHIARQVKLCSDSHVCMSSSAKQKLVRDILCATRHWLLLHHCQASLGTPIIKCVQSIKSSPLLVVPQGPGLIFTQQETLNTKPTGQLGHRVMLTQLCPCASCKQTHPVSTGYVGRCNQQHIRRYLVYVGLHRVLTIC